ncbi:glycosyltransferase family 15 protein [Schizophyllum amplum]|uniref:Glycosyltransferase family 15 protein n=1 Tax=Schizophyllum amplum TaxID=97359 RepID=A0A550C521_9AGAR|nr:glycosyltransferase family 15 protein [Auriculariopsis ampla]
MSAAKRARLVLVFLALVLTPLLVLYNLLKDVHRDATEPFDLNSPTWSSASEDVVHLSPSEGDEDANNLADDHSLGPPKRANATFIILARNSDLAGTVQSITEIEQRFNKRYQYPYVILNDQEFTADFKRTVTGLTPSLVEFGLIPREDWVQPVWIDEERAAEARRKMVDEGVKYGGDVTYRNMCRFNSGFFYRQPLMQKYKYYWRIEPNVHFLCDIHFDPFLFMQEQEKVYGFTLAVHEIAATVPTLWDTAKTFTDQHPEYLASDNALGFITRFRSGGYNGCHFWSNFEIADMDFFRGEAYSQFFDFLDRSGGYYYERWGDAPVHSIAVSLFLNASKIHFFDPIGYQHDDWRHCPLDRATFEEGNCDCDYKKEFDYSGGSCKAQWDHFVRTSGLESR